MWKIYLPDRIDTPVSPVSVTVCTMHPNDIVITSC